METIKIEIVNVSNRSLLYQFILFPKGLYKSDANFIFEPVSMQKEFMSTKNPFFEHSSADYFLACSNGKILGRIAWIDNTVHNKIYNEKTAFFGFFESIEEYEVARSLFDKVVEISKAKGFTRLMGPTNFTTNDSCGILDSGFDQPPVIMMPYNKSYYKDYLSRYGFVKEMNLRSYHIDNKTFKTPHFTNLESRISGKLSAKGITIRTINYNKLDEEIIPFREVYNRSNLDNWGFIPLNEKEFQHTAHQLREFVPERLILIAEKENKQIGFIVALPDLNQVFSHMRSGRLLPLGFLKFLWYRRKISISRVLILGVLPEYRNLGLDILLYIQIQNNLSTLGIQHGEACYVMESNLKMNSIIGKLEGKCVKKYSIYRIGL